MRLVLLSFPGGSYAGSHPGAEARWYVGEEREVPEATAAYLLSTFGEYFAMRALAPLPGTEPEGEAPPPVEAASGAPAEPSGDRAIRSPSRRRRG